MRPTPAGPKDVPDPVPEHPQPIVDAWTALGQTGVSRSDQTHLAWSKRNTRNPS